MTRRGSALALVFSSAIVACAGDHETAPAPEELTFEVLHIGVDSPSSFRGGARLAAVSDALASAQVDVVCIQGVGDDGDRLTLKRALGKVFPSSLELPTDDATAVDDPRDVAGVVPPSESRAPCVAMDDTIDQVFGCLQLSFCLATDDGPVLDESCIIPSDTLGLTCTPSQVFTADPERRCRSCLAGHLRTGASLHETRSRCTTVVHPLVTHGAHGMMILSKLPLSRATLHVLPAEGTRRAILGATITTARGKEVDVVCASLGPTGASALPSDPNVVEPYPGPYGGPTDGWARENELQIDKLVAHVAERRGDRPAVILGNFGASEAITRRGGVTLPAVGNVGARRLADAFVPGVAPDYLPSCTVCSENPLVDPGAITSFQNRIYLAGLPASAVHASTRSYLGGVVIASPNPLTASERLPLSMQYGFRSTIAAFP